MGLCGSTEEDNYVVDFGGIQNWKISSVELGYVIIERYTNERRSLK